MYCTRGQGPSGLEGDKGGGEEMLPCSDTPLVLSSQPCQPDPVTQWRSGKGLERNQGKETEQWEKTEDSPKGGTEMGSWSTKSDLHWCVCEQLWRTTGHGWSSPGGPCSPFWPFRPRRPCPPLSPWRRHGTAETMLACRWLHCNEKQLSVFHQCVLTFSPLSPRSPLSPFTPGKPWTQIQIADKFTSSPQVHGVHYLV